MAAPAPTLPSFTDAEGPEGACTDKIGASVHYLANTLESSDCVAGCETISAPGQHTRTGQQYLIKALYTGASCTGGHTPIPPVDGDICTGSLLEGNLYCQDVAQTKPGCGTFNGEFVCLDDVPPGTCYFMPGGSYICASDAPAANKPDTGTPGEVATPVATITHNNDSIEIYNQSQVRNSSVQVTGNSGIDDRQDNTGLATESTLQDISRKLDSLAGEGGSLPAQDDFTQGLGDLDQYIDELGSIPEPAKPDFNPFTGLITESPGCEQVRLDFAGREFRFPGSEGCQRLGTLKAILSFLFYGYTVFFLIDLITNRQSV